MTNKEMEFSEWQAAIDKLSFEYDREKLSKGIQSLEARLSSAFNNSTATPATTNEQR